MFAVSIVLLFAVFALLYYRVYDYGRRWYLIRKLPGPVGLPFIGNMLSFVVSAVDLWIVLRGMNDAYYPLYKVSTPQWTIINIRHPDDAEVLLTSTRHISKSAIYAFLHPWFKTGLLTSTGKKWQQRRKILTPAFHFNVLREFIGIFNKEARRMIRDLGDAKDTREHELLSLITKYTLNTICETSMGTSLESLTSYQTSFRKTIHDMGNYLLYRMLRPWMHPSFVFELTPTGRKQKKALEILHDFSTEIIGKRLLHQYKSEDVFSEQEDTPSVEKCTRPAMLDILIAAMKEGRIDEAGVREEVDTFIFEGHDTSGMGMAFTLLLLAEHKDIQVCIIKSKVYCDAPQQRARDEVDSVLKASNGIMNFTEIHQCTYLEQCIKESLRLFPSVPFISRSIDEDLQLKDYLIPRGVIAHVHIYDLHRDPHFWPDPHTFDPDRFLPDRSVGRHPFAYIPFSAGPRNCIGQKFAMFELKVLIGHLLHNFYIEPIDLASEVRLLTDLVLRPTHPIRVKFVPREL